MATIGDISMISPPTSSISNDQDPFGQLPPLPPPLRSTQVLQPLSVFPGARPSNYPAICPPNILNYFPHTLYSIYLLLCICVPICICSSSRCLPAVLSLLFGRSFVLQSFFFSGFFFSLPEFLYSFFAH